MERMIATQKKKQKNKRKRACNKDMHGHQAAKIKQLRATDKNFFFEWGKGEKK